MKRPSCARPNVTSPSSCAKRCPTAASCLHFRADKTARSPLRITETIITHASAADPARNKRETSSPPAPRWQFWVEALGAGILAALPLTILHLSPSRQTLYHELLPMNSVYKGVLIDFLVLVLFSAIALWLVEKCTWLHRGLAWVLVFAILPMRVLRGLVVAEIVSPKTVSGGQIFLILAAAGLLLWIVRRSWYTRAVLGGRLLLLLIGFSGLWLLPELGWLAFRPEPHETACFSTPIAQAPQRRIVWVLFDEASQDQIFDHRQPGVEYPNFDRLAAQAVHFTDVQPAGYFTEKVIPSLFTGDIITSEESDLDGRLFVRTRADRRRHLYPEDKTLFADARHEGWSTAIAGWYNPYCRILSTELDDCYWTLTTPLPGHYDPRGTALQNAVAPLAKSLLRIAGRPIQDPTPWQMHAADYSALMRHAREEIDGRAGFVFIHMPLPHPGGFYNRRTHQIGVDGSYLDNLVLTDQTLGELLQTIDTTPEAAQTTVIVSSDHSWRVSLWRPTTDWRSEDTRVSAGRFDPRPLLIVRFPGERDGVTLDHAFPLIEMYGMIEAMLAGHMNSPSDLQTSTLQH
jgi:hypothetical protein